MQVEQTIDLQGYTVEEAEKILLTHKKASQKRAETFEQKRAEREAYLNDHPEERARIEEERKQKAIARANKERTLRTLAQTGQIILNGKPVNIEDLKAQAGI